MHSGQGYPDAEERGHAGGRGTRRTWQVPGGPGLTGALPEGTTAVPAHSHCEAQDSTAQRCSALGTVLRLVHADQLALQADMADAVLLRDWLGHRVEGQRECCPRGHSNSPLPTQPQARRARGDPEIKSQGDGVLTLRPPSMPSVPGAGLSMGLRVRGLTPRDLCTTAWPVLKAPSAQTCRNTSSDSHTPTHTHTLPHKRRHTYFSTSCIIHAQISENSYK